ncbi:MAG: hypothetical protein WAU25_06520 [Nitrososphaeraceae archaeon]
MYLAAAAAAPPPNVAAAATVGGTSAAACLGWAINLKIRSVFIDYRRSLFFNYNEFSGL